MLCGKHDKEVRQLREELATIKVNQPKHSRRRQGNSGYPQVIAKHEEEIASIGRMFSLTWEMFLPDNYNTIITSSSCPQQSLVNSPQRYITKAAEEAGVLSEIVFAGPVRWTGKKTDIGLNPTAKDRTTGCGCTNSEFFRLPGATFVEKSKNRRKPVFRPVMCWTLLTHIFP